MASSTWYFIIHYSTYCVLINLSQGVPLIGKNVREAKDNEFPFVVSIGRRNQASLQDSQFCTGTLISSRRVLTAAHCLLVDNIQDIEIIAGSADLRKGKRYRAESWLSYDKWKFKVEDRGSPMHDIAIITLAEPVKGCHVVPATINATEPEDLYKTSVQIAGWGTSENDVQPMILKTAVVNVISNEQCERKIRLATLSSFYVPRYQFCSLAVPWVLSTCGDSGSPILNKENKLVGVHKGICPDPETYTGDYDEEVLKQDHVNIHYNLIDYVDFINAVKQ